MAHRTTWLRSDFAAYSTPCGAIPSIPLSFSLANVLPPEPTGCGFLVVGGLALEGSLDCPFQGRAGTVYGAGLRRCLIIFAPRTLILDRRTRACRTPSLRSILQRSKNFTSGVAVSFTLNGPLGDGRCAPHGPHEKPGGGRSTQRTHKGWQWWAARTRGSRPPRVRGTHHIAQERAPRPVQLQCLPQPTAPRTRKYGATGGGVCDYRSVDALTFHGRAFSRHNERLLGAHWVFHGVCNGGLRRWTQAVASCTWGAGGGPHPPTLDVAHKRPG